MTSKEAARKHWLELKDKPFKDKVEHIVTYYGIVILIILSVLIFAVSYTVHLLTLKDSALNITCIGATVTQKRVDAFVEDFASTAGIDTQEYEVDLSTNLSSYQQGNYGNAYDTAEIMMAMVASKKVDAILSDTTTFIPYMYQGLFADVSKTLTAEQVERYKDLFLYADQAIADELRDMTVVEELPEFPDPTKPENMKQPVPIAIRIPENTDFYKAFFPNLEGYAACGIAVNAVNVENTLAFLDYIMVWNEVTQ